MQDIKAYLSSHMQKELCRFITCGSVDDGKSTLMGRLLYDSKVVFSDMLSTLEQESKKFGTRGEELDFALLVDGLSSEREQGITIDVAYRFFTSEKRKFIMADTPGHEQYTRNMATGASTADIAIILIDARKGVLPQTKRHSYIVSLLGIKHFIIAVNKMDLIAYDELKFKQIQNSYENFLPSLKKDINTYFLPLCALSGENVLQRSSNMPWYSGKTLLELLDSIELDYDKEPKFSLAVQYINRPHLNFRAFCGEVASGVVKLGDDVRILPQNKSSKISKIITSDIKELKTLSFDEKPEGMQEACVKSQVSLCLEDEIDISRGDVICHKDYDIKISNSFKAMLIYMSEQRFDINDKHEYIIKRANLSANACIENIEYKKDINKFEDVKSEFLELNDIALCSIKVQKILPLLTYEENKTLGSFILIDRYSNETVAAGMICEISAQSKEARTYSEAEKELNAFIRKHYPEWEAKKI